MKPLDLSNATCGFCAITGSMGVIAICAVCRGREEGAFKLLVKLTEKLHYAPTETSAILEELEAFIRGKR